MMTVDGDHGGDPVELIMDVLVRHGEVMVIDCRVSVDK